MYTQCTVKDEMFFIPQNEEKEEGVEVEGQCKNHKVIHDQIDK